MEVRKGLVLACALLPLAVTNIRAPLSSCVTMSDATPDSFGTVGASVSPELSTALHVAAEHRGCYVRLDWDEDDWAAVQWTHAELPHDHRSLLAAVPWEVWQSSRFSTPGHVTIQEAKAVRAVLRQLCQGSLKASRHVNGSDSRVVL